MKYHHVVLAPLLISLTLGGWGSEVQVNSTTGFVTAPGHTWDLAASGWRNDFLIAWQDIRFADTPSVFVSILNSDGGAELEEGLLASPIGAGRPSVSTHLDLAAITWEARGETWLRLMRRDRTFITPPIHLGGGRCPRVALGPSGGMVVREDNDIVVQRFANDGTLLDAAPISLSTNVPYGVCARVAFDTTFTMALVAWRAGDPGPLRTAFVPPTGAVVTETTLNATPAPANPEIATTGAQRWFVAGAVPGAMAPLINIPGYDVTPSSVLPIPFLGDDTWLGGDLVPCSEGICFIGLRDGPMVTLTSGTMPTDGGALTLGVPQPALSGDFVLAASEDGRQLAIAASFYSPLEVAVGPSDFSPGSSSIVLSRGRRAQAEAEVAVLNDVALVAWIQQSVTGEPAVVAQRFDSQGIPVDALPFTVFDATGDGFSEIELMVTPTEWVIVTAAWGSEESWIARVTSAGTVRDAHQLTTRGMHTGFALAGDDVVGSFKQYRTNWWDPVFATIHPDGGEDTVPAQDTPPKEEFTDVAVTGDGTRLIVWQDADPQGLVAGAVFGARISPSGNVIDSPSIRLSPASSREALQPQVVSDGYAGFFIAWKSWDQVFAMHLSGITPSGPPITILPGDGESLGQLNLIATSPKTAVLSFTNTADGGVLARELTFSSNGIVASPVETLSPVAGFNAAPSMAIGATAAWATYARATTNGNTMEVFVRTFRREAESKPCTAGWMCASDQCSSNACLGGGTVVTDGGMMSMNDAGSTVTTDGGLVGEDGGVVDGGGDGSVRRYSIGCGCGSSPVGALLFAVTLLLRRRTSRR